ncbi:MAG: SPFH domain-containing protein [Epsilonproteobacteria bacterium]|nr:SPFH domain-containing protein [Campylobacterota bacterium]
MKKMTGMIILILLVGYFVIIKRTTVTEGTEAVIIDKPWFFGKSGVQKTPIAKGTIWSTRSTEVKLVSVRFFEIAEPMEAVLTLDNNPIKLTIYLTFKNIKGKTPLLVEKFGNNNEWYEHLLRRPLQNTVRVFIKKHTLESILNDELKTAELKDAIHFGVEEFLKTHKIPTQLIDINIPEITPPNELIEASIQTEVEKQNAKTEQIKIETEKLRQIVQEEKAKADRAYMKKMNLSPRQYLELMKIELESKRLANQRHALDSAKDSNGSIQVQINMGK